MDTKTDYQHQRQALERLAEAIETHETAGGWRTETITLIQRLFESALTMIVGFDRHGRCFLWNKECEWVFGWTADEVMAHPDPFRLFYPEASSYQAVKASLDAGNGSRFQEWTPLARDGRQLTTLWANLALPGGDMIGIGHDVSEQRQAENQQRVAASVFESSEDAIMITDNELRLCDTNAAFTRITGYAKEEVLGRLPDMLGDPQRNDNILAAIYRHLAERDSWRGELVGQHRNGDEYPLQLTVSVVRDEQERVLHYVGTFSDITHLKRHQEELKHLARHDALTELPNRRHFAEQLEHARHLTRRNDDILAVCFIDLDGFKPINDSLGHAAGDQALTTIARRLQNAIRPYDVLGRLGGDEFALLLTGLRDSQEYRPCIERIHQLIGRPITLGDSVVRLTGSIGITLFPHDDEDAERLLCHADQAMYRAKRSGKNRHCLFDPREHGETHRSQRRPESP